MTQTTRTEAIANHVAAIRRATGAARDSHINALAELVPMDIVVILASAADRYQAASTAVVEAEARWHAAMDTVVAMVGAPDRHAIAVISAIASAAATVVESTDGGSPEYRASARRALVEATGAVAAMVPTAEGRAATMTLANRAMVAAMADRAEWAAKAAWRNAAAEARNA